MHGNVWEWVQDCWSKNYTDGPRDQTARIFGNCELRVLRGGSWADEEGRYLRAAMRGRSRQQLRTAFTGFRVAQDLSREWAATTDIDSCPIHASLSVEPLELYEHSGETTVTVIAKIENVQPIPTTIALSIDERDDYTFAWSGDSPYVTVDAGETRGTTTLTLTPVDDNNFEPTEAVSIHGRSDGLIEMSVEMDLINTYQNVVLSVTPTRISEQGGPTSVTITAESPQASKIDREFKLRLVGSAIEDVDYTASWSEDVEDPPTVSIGRDAVSGTATLTIDPHRDNVTESFDETITIEGLLDDLLVLSSDLKLTEGTLTAASRR